MSKLVKVMALAAFVSGGREILPGPASVPAEAVARLVEKNYIAVPDGALMEGETGGEAQGGSTPEVESLRAENEQLRTRVAELEAQLTNVTKTATTGDGISLDALESLGEEVMQSLIVGGFGTHETIAAASNKDLEALPNIGEATVKKIRALLK